MAERLEEFPQQVRRSLYPWDEWLDGGIWRLARGRDFNSKPATLRTRLQAQAKRRGGRARTSLQTVDGVDCVVVQFVRTGPRAMARR